MVDVSAVARVLGITTTFKDLRGGAALFLPQRNMVIAQGATASTYATTKSQETSATAVGEKYGFGSPLHLIARELFPSNGDGVGSIPVTFYPLTDDGSGVFAAGDVTPSGTATKTATYRVRISGLLSEQWTIAKDVAVTGAALHKVLRDMGNAINAVVELPVTVGYTYGTITGTPGGGNTGNGTITALSATGAPVPGDWTLTCNTAVAEGGVWTLTDPDGTVVSTSVTMTPGAGASTVIDVAGLQFTLTDGTTDFIVGDTFTIGVPATKLDLTSKWKGTTANDIHLEVLGESVGVTYAITQPTGGAANPDVQPALDQVGNVWETMGLNAMGSADTAALDKLQTWGDGRWGELVHRPIVFFHGNTDTTVAAATAVSSTRKTDKVNCQLVAPGSVNLPFVVAARQMARISKVANNNPPTNYPSQKATGILPGLDSIQWDHAQRDQAVKAGSSTVEVLDGVVSLADIVTFFTPTGDPTPAYRYVVDIVKLQNVIFNLELEFAKDEWKGAPMIPNDQPTVNPAARKPRTAKAAANAILSSLGDNAILADTASTNKLTTAVINAQNPKRLDMTVTVKLSGNFEIIDTGLNFGFFFGSQAAA